MEREEDFIRTATSDGSAATQGGYGPQLDLQIGPYRLLERLGEGGFGEVWRAEQREPVKRHVALKFIKLGMDTKQIIARFEAERQALAMMDHRHIAKVFDAGTTEAGRPYFVMELVQGVPILKYCDTEKLTTKRRLELFIEVCHAIQHAHQKGIIHRDIKPSNVLVTLQDGDPEPKVIDFGIAKATNVRLTEKTLFTAQQQIIGTPAYMSPEQAEMSGLDIDTRSDIYSLGVLLYELITGTTPFDGQQLLSAGIAEMMRIIREEEPHKPSTRLSTLDETATRVAQQRGTDSKKLSLIVRGDLDWIVMKCLEKDRTRRYESASGLAADVQRFLNDEPVVARPPSTTYRFRKFVRRNRMGVLACALIALALLIGLVGTVTFALRAAEQQRIAEDNEERALSEKTRAEAALAQEAEQRRLAEQNQQTAQRVQTFLQRMLESVDPERARGRDVTILREILDQAAEQAEDELADQPEVLATILNTIGITYLGLGRYDEAEELLSASLRIRRELFGDEHIDVAETLSNLGSLKIRTSENTAAETLLREAVTIKRKLLSDDDPGIAITLNNLANCLDNLGKWDEAENIHRQVLAHRQKTLGHKHPDVAITMNNLAYQLMNRGSYDEAEAMFREVLEIRYELYGDDHIDVAFSLLNLGHLLMLTGRFAEAEPMQIKALELRRRLLGNEHSDTAYALNGLATNYHKQGNYAAAEPLYKEALPILKRSFGEDDWRVTRVMTSLADGLRLQGKHDEAETLYRELLDHHRQSADTAAIIKTLILLGQVVQAGGDLQAAEALLLEAQEMCVQAPEISQDLERDVLERLIELYDAWHTAEPGAGYDSKAAEWLVKLEQQ